MDKNGQPYLRALSEDAPRPLRSVLSHLPLYFAGMLVIWTPGILNRFPGAQSVSAPWLRSVTPEIVFVTWTVLLVYTGFLILSAVRPASSTAAVASLPRRISRTIPPTIQTCLVMGLIQAGQVVIASVHRSHTPPAEELTSTVLFYGLEAAVGVATFCTLLATIALGMSRVHRWWLYVVGAWAVYVVVDRIQRYATFVPLPWSRGTVFRSGLEFGRPEATNVFINGFPGNYFPSGENAAGQNPPYANIDVHNIWINIGILTACVALLLVVALTSLSRHRGSSAGSRGSSRAHGPRPTRPSASDDDREDGSLIPWDRDETTPSSRRLGP